jgi:hypothetical protein
MPESADKIRSINAALAQWQGEQAQFWTYTATLAALEIRLFSSRRPGNLHLACTPCLSISGPVSWDDCALTVAAAPGEEDLFLVQDQAAGVRVLCRQVYLFDNVEPLFPPAITEQPRQSPALGAHA